MNIATLTMNPAIDLIMAVPVLKTGAVNRCTSGNKFISGGKGINVSRNLKQLGVDNTAVFPCGNGLNGEQFMSGLNLACVTVMTECDTRVNVKVMSECAENAEIESITEINGCYTLLESEIAAITAKLYGLLNSGDLLIMCGSLPNGTADGFYAKTATELNAKGVTVIADTSGEPLRLLSETDGVFLIKPNQHELSSLSEKVTCNILASYGSDGAELTLTDGTKYRYGSPEILIGGYTVGAGDALLSGFIAEYLKSKDYEKALVAGVDYATDYLKSFN